MVRLSLPALFSFRDLAISAVIATIDADDVEVGSDGREEMVSALTEAFNNIVLHAYRGIRGGRVDLQVEASGGEIEIQLSDRGFGFELDDVPIPDLEALPESGMGLYIMRSFMDEVTYTRGGGTKPNVLVLRKRWVTSRRAADSAPMSDAPQARKETSQSGWRMRSVAVPIHAQSTAGSLRRK